LKFSNGGKNSETENGERERREREVGTNLKKLTVLCLKSFAKADIPQLYVPCSLNFVANVRIRIYLPVLAKTFISVKVLFIIFKFCTSKEPFSKIGIGVAASGEEELGWSPRRA